MSEEGRSKRPDKLSRKGPQRMSSHFLDPCSDPKNGKSLLLFYHCARFSNKRSKYYIYVWPICMPAHHGSNCHGHRDFELVLRYKKYRDSFDYFDQKN